MAHASDTYAPVLAGEELPIPAWQTAEQVEVHDLISRCAIAFAARCRHRPDQKFPKDKDRQPVLRYGRGLGHDEASAFLRALKAGLAFVEGDGNFRVPEARACSSNLHLVGRHDDHIALHTEALIHVGAYAELVLDHGWEPRRIAFDPFTRGAALDLWGFDGGVAPGMEWWEGRVIFAAEAKARVAGSDSLTDLAKALGRLEADPGAAVGAGHRRKWEELVTIVTAHGAIDLLLVADGARWWYRVEPQMETVRLVRQM